MAQAGHRGSPLERIARDDPHLRAQRRLTVDDVAGDVLGEVLDEQRLADHDLLDRLLEQLREARHVDAFLRRLEVDRAVDLGGDELLRVAMAQPDRLADAADAGVREPEADVRLRSLDVLCEKVSGVHHDPV